LLLELQTPIARI